jgi:dTDP-4-amino-4,6-dideoxygalactose transaminase
MKNLKEVGIISQVHYIPIPSQPYYQQLGYSTSDIPNAFSYYEETLTIPLFPSLKKREQRRIVKFLEDLV